MADEYNQLDGNPVTGNTFAEALVKINDNWSSKLTIKPPVQTFAQLTMLDAENVIRLVSNEKVFYIRTASTWERLRSYFEDEITNARGTHVSLDARMDRVLEEDGDLKPDTVANANIQYNPSDPIDQEKIQQGHGSGLDADTLDGDHLSDIDGRINEIGDRFEQHIATGADDHVGVYVKFNEYDSISNTMMQDDSVGKGDIKSNIAGPGLQRNVDKTFSPAIARVKFAGKTLIPSDSSTSIVCDVDASPFTESVDSSQDIVQVSLQQGASGDNLWILNWEFNIGSIIVNINQPATNSDNYIHYVVYSLT